MHCSLFLRLPQEIHLIIINLCGRAEQKALRCCCTALDACISPVLYRTVYLDILPSSMTRVHNIANKSQIGQHVRQAAISTNLLAPCSFRSFERQIRYHEPVSLKALDEDVALLIVQNATLWGTVSAWKRRSWLESRFKSYWGYVDFQKSHLENESKTLCALLMKFPNLRKVTIYKLDDITKSTSWVDVSREIFPDIEDCFSLHDWTSAMVDNYSILTHLMLECGLLVGCLTSLEVDFVPWDTWHASKVYKSWGNLRILKLRAGCDNTTQARSLVTHGLAMVIRSIPLVMELQISIVPSCSYLTRIDFHRVFCDSSQLTNLQILGFQTGLIDQWNLLALYQRHRNTLRTLTICDFHLSGGNWQEVLTQFSAYTDRCNFAFEALTDGDGWNIHTAIPFCYTMRF